MPKQDPDVHVTENRSEVVSGADGHRKRLYIAAPTGNLIEAHLNAMYEEFKADEAESDKTDLPFEYEIIRVRPAVEVEYTKVFRDPDHKATLRKKRRRVLGLDN